LYFLGAARVPSGTFLQFSDFTNKTDYANYLRKHLSVGMHVRCCNGYGDIQEGDTGTIIHVERDIIENFNVKVFLEV
jgi:E3 ubiquitin-protein ligase HERC2